MYKKYHLVAKATQQDTRQGVSMRVYDLLISLQLAKLSSSRVARLVKPDVKAILNYQLTINYNGAMKRSIAVVKTGQILQLMGYSRENSHLILTYLTYLYSCCHIHIVG